MDTYKVNDSSDEVQIEVNAGVLGIAGSNVYLRLDNGFNKILSSEEMANGSIPFSPIDENQNLSSGLIHIRTLINFSNIPEDEREQAIENILLEYNLKGGSQGLVDYVAAGLDIVIINPTMVLINKLIKFV